MNKIMKTSKKTVLALVMALFVCQVGAMQYNIGGWGKGKLVQEYVKSRRYQVLGLSFSNNSEFLFCLFRRGFCSKIFNIKDLNHIKLIKALKDESVRDVCFDKKGEHFVALLMYPDGIMLYKANDFEFVKALHPTEMKWLDYFSEKLVCLSSKGKLIYCQAKDYSNGCHFIGMSKDMINHKTKVRKLRFDGYLFSLVKSNKGDFCCICTVDYDDNNIKTNILETENFKKIKTLQGEVSCFGKDDSFVCYIIDDNLVKILDTKAWKCKTSIKLGKEVKVYSADFSPCGRYIAAGTNKGIIEIWDIENKEIAKDLVYDSNLKKSWEVMHIKFSPNGKLIAASFRPEGDNTKKGIVALWPTPPNLWVTDVIQKRTENYSDVLIFFYH